MDIFFCIPIIFGCNDKIKQEGDGQPYVCPRCHNAQVITARKRTWFELCWVPLIPFKNKHIYMCGICQWQIDQGGSWQPQPAGAQGPPQGAPQGGYGGGYPAPQKA